MNRSFFICIGLLILFALVSCAGSSGNSGNPLTPSDTNHQAAVEGRTLWGLWHVSIDPDTFTPEITPLRGADFTANVTRFLQPPIAPTNLVSISMQPGSNPSIGYFVINVTVRHPFPGNKLFRGFDVRGIMMSNGTVHSAHEPNIVYAGFSDTHLKNADGWSRWWNATEFTTYDKIFGYTQGKLAPPNYPTSTLNGYKYFADGLTADEKLASLNPATRGTFSVDPGLNTRRYEIQFKMSGGKPAFDFNYAIDASWSLPDPAYQPDYPIEAFDLMANCQEAYWVDADFTGSTAWYVSPTENGGDLHVALEVGDWQALEDGVNVPDEISAIWIESAKLGIEPVNVLPSAVATDGNGVTTSVFSFDITGVNPSEINNQVIMVSVYSTDPSTYKPQVPSGGSFAYPDAPLASHIFFDVPISDTPPIDKPVVLKIDPDEGLIDSGDLLVHITGLNFDPDVQVELEKYDDPSVILPGLIQGTPTETAIDCIIDMDSADGAEIGVYHVRATNPGPPTASGQLDDGFLIYSPVTCDEVHKEMIYEGTMQPGYFTFDVAFNSEGLLLLKGYYESKYRLLGYDVTQNGTIAPVKVVIPDLAVTHSIISIDVDDLYGNIIIVGWTDDNHVWVYGPDGTLIQDFYNNGTYQVCSIDTDVDGSIWIVGFTIDPDSKISSYLINHYVWNTGTGLYEYDAATSADVTSSLLAGISYPHCMDCVVSYKDRILFVMSSSVARGKLYGYDISSGAPVFDPTHTFSNFFPTSMGLNGAGYWRNAADIEIDHSNLLYEDCRMIVYSRLYWDQGMAFVKMDTDGNVLDTYNELDANSLDHMFYGFAINRKPADPDGLYIACTDDSSFGGSPNGDYNVYKAPAGW